MIDLSNRFRNNWGDGLSQKQGAGTENPNNSKSIESDPINPAAWFWEKRSQSGAGKLNLVADRLDMTLSAVEHTRFNLISAGIGNAGWPKRWTNYTGNVNVITTVGNPYESMQQVLQRLGIKTANAAGYEKQFGIALHTPTALAIDTGPHLLMTDTATNPPDSSTSPTTDPSLPAMQALLAQAQAELNLQQGGFAMLVPDMPNMPPQSTPVVMIAQTNQATRANAERVMGVCHVVANVPDALEKYDAGVFPSQPYVYPWSEISVYFREVEHRDINIYAGNAGPLDTSSSAIVQPPKHGTLVDAGVGKYQAYLYKPDAGYFGDDSAVVKAEVNGLQVKIHYYFHSMDTKAFSESVVCGEKGLIWKISQSPNGTPTLTAVNYQSPTIDAGATTTDTAALASTLSTNVLSSLFAGTSGVTMNLADLPSGAIGQTVGVGINANITLDTNAAGGMSMVHVNGVRLD